MLPLMANHGFHSRVEPEDQMPADAEARARRRRQTAVVHATRSRPDSRPTGAASGRRRGGLAFSVAAAAARAGGRRLRRARGWRSNAGERPGDGDRRPARPPPARRRRPVEQHSPSTIAHPASDVGPPASAHGAADAAVAVLSFGRVAPVVVEGAAGRVAEIPIQDRGRGGHLLAAGRCCGSSVARKIVGRGLGREQVALPPQIVGIVAAIELARVRRAVGRRHQRPVRLVDPVEDHGDLQCRRRCDRCA